MTKKTLFARIDRSSQLNQIERSLRRFLEDLDAKAQVVGVIADKWPQIEISGEDEGIVTNYIDREIGFCPEKIQTVKKYATLKGYVAGLDENGEGLKVDAGIFEPSTLNATVPLDHLRAQLADGKEVDIKKIAESYGFCRGLPLQLKVTNIDRKENRMEMELSTAQVVKYKLWIESLLDRLIVIGATRDEIQKALDHTGLIRDVINVESLGLFEHALTCKIGTDAVGIVSIAGRRLRNAKFTVFNPRKLWKT
jgi:hypothetical protein